MCDIVAELIYIVRESTEPFFLAFDLTFHLTHLGTHLVHRQSSLFDAFFVAEKVRARRSIGVHWPFQFAGIHAFHDAAFSDSAGGGVPTSDSVAVSSSCEYFSIKALMNSGLAMAMALVMYSL